MLRIAQTIVRGRRAVMAITALLVIAGIWGMMNNRINYDLMSYLPADLDSMQGLEIVDEEFALGTMVQIMVYDESDATVDAIAERIREVEGVKAVHWVTDLAPVTQPTEFRDEEVVSNYYAEGGTLLQVAFDGGSNDPHVKEAIRQIRDLLDGYDTLLTGHQQLELEEVMSQDTVRFALAALVLVTIVLLLTIPSIVVPLLFVLTIGAAVVLNLGLSHYLDQQMSYITGVIVFALQFAVTMDYALFLYHRFDEERRRSEPEEAMITAVATTFKSISAAAITTFAGFLALMVMHLGFGEDLGVTLARGVLITLVAVVTLLPALILTALPLIDRIRHKTPSFDFSRLGHFIAKHAGVVSVVGLLLFVPALWANSQISITYDLNTSLPHDMPSVQADEAISEAFGREGTMIVALEDTGSAVDLERLSDRLEGVEGVTRAFGYGSLVDPRIPVEFVPAEARESFFSGGYTYLTLDVSYDMADPRLTETIEAVRAVSDEEWPGASYVTGQSVLMNDMERVSEGDDVRINLISIVAIVVIIGIAFKSVAIPVALVAVIQLAILVNQGFEAFGGGELIFVSSLAIGAIQLGATVDYAILITTRYEEELKRTRDRVEAITVAVSESSQSILVSASTMFAATIALAVMSSIGIISSLTMLIARGALVSFFVVLVILPAILVVGQPLYERLSIGWPRHTVKGE
ncbi:efflux RND transporter permease subunit [Anaerosoma tenue]|uniref:efflux RND transporter permease subunit n=1 Tax=Anaerosoma tenue TaxID=2933588 RepID=UPI002260C0BD|nr:MMPL family transporter [Anaerosoma tenue]MCK8115506.1 MMPL family transporter [Anaerosoma tenue]